MLRPRMTPLAPGRSGLEVTLDQETHDLLQEAREPTSHENPTGGIVAVLKGALRCYVDRLRNRKYAATTRPRPARRGTSARHIPAAVKRAVWERDGGRCTFVSDSGHRCPARTFLEFDHVEPVARGGEATVANLRLRCRPHNGYEAERTFGTAFMNGKREAARHAAAAT